ncbi:unnamed protein product [Anisakis simplex]|uniref:SAM-dependent MTase TRM10-type domain-containing protein n=1 Tax=Anisakis simplex TaxID=6269 RepID=A0A0M3J9Z5_ANISI|nr:unnamed protein product [Anisakis simplex]
MVFFMFAAIIVMMMDNGIHVTSKIKGDETFILGGIVDRTNEIGLPKQASLLAAKQANVVARKLPLDRYIKWKSGTKLLTLTAVASILYDVYDSNGSWEFALKKFVFLRKYPFSFVLIGFAFALRDHFKRCCT